MNLEPPHDIVNEVAWHLLGEKIAGYGRVRRPHVARTRHAGDTGEQRVSHHNGEPAACHEGG